MGNLGGKATIVTGASKGIGAVRHGSDPVEEARRVDLIRTVCGSHRTAGSIATPAGDAHLPGANRIEKKSCAYRGQTFFGDFRVRGSGPDAVVSVRHHGQELEAKVGNASIEAAAETLLQEIVTREMISMVIANR